MRRGCRSQTFFAPVAPLRPVQVFFTIMHLAPRVNQLAEPAETTPRGPQPLTSNVPIVPPGRLEAAIATALGSIKNGAGGGAGNGPFFGVGLAGCSRLVLP
jgi:hypothetical protein